MKLFLIVAFAIAGIVVALAFMPRCPTESQTWRIGNMLVGGCAKPAL